MILFVDISRENILCRKIAIPLYAEARQFHLLQLQYNF